MFEEEGGAGKVAQRYLLFKLTVSSDHQYLTNVLLENFLELGGGFRCWEQGRLGELVELEEGFFRG